ncbi:MAG: protein-export chaperone SecB [Caulobacteraceae bacterium]
MTDIDLGGAPAADQPQAEPGFRVLAQFIRDLSFENPHAPDSLRSVEAQPQMDVGVEMGARVRPDGLYEVDLKISASAARNDAAVFHCELVYGGLFQITGIPEADIEPILMIECPRILFPFARQIISEVSTSGGFPPFMLDPLDFAGIYMSQKQQQANLAAEAPAGQA